MIIATVIFAKSCMILLMRDVWILRASCALICGGTQWTSFA